MEPKHRDILQANREKLVNSIYGIDTIVSELHARGILTIVMVEDIEAIPTKAKKIRELLSLLPRRGENAFNTFYDVLVSKDVDETVAADLLMPESRKQAKSQGQSSPSSSMYTDSDEEPLPEIWPSDDPEFDHDDHSVTMCKQNSTMSKIFQKICDIPLHNEIFCMKKEKRGFCVIINNEEFEKSTQLDERTGSEQDYSAVMEVFDNLNFKTICARNQTAKQIEGLAKKYSEDPSNEDYECFVMVIMSHGSKGNVYGKDGEQVEISKITDYFASSHCSSLIGKPKLFFVQACQTDDTVSELSIEKMKLSQHRADGDGATTFSDFFIARATIAGQAALRNDTGTYFIQAVVYVFRKYANKRELTGLMTKVNQLVKTSDGGGKQVSIYNSSLTKDLYFFPGLIDEQPVQPQPLNQMHPSDD